MKVLQIGSFAILVKWVILIVAFLIGLFFIKTVLKSSLNKEISKKVFDLYSNSLFLLFLLWKGSLLLLEPKLIIKSPLSLLYFTGGEKGLVIASGIIILYFIYQGRKLISIIVLLQSLLSFSLIVSSAYHFLFLFFLEKNELFHLLIGSFTSILLLLIYRWKKPISKKKSHTKE